MSLKRHLGHHFWAGPAERVLFCSHCWVWFRVSGKGVDRKLELFPHLSCHRGLVIRQNLTMLTVAIWMMMMWMVVKAKMEEEFKFSRLQTWTLFISHKMRLKKLVVRFVVIVVERTDVNWSYIFINCKLSSSPCELADSNHTCYYLVKSSLMTSLKG